MDGRRQRLCWPLMHYLGETSKVLDGIANDPGAFVQDRIDCRRLLSARKWNSGNKCSKTAIKQQEFPLWKRNKRSPEQFVKVYVVCEQQRSRQERIGSARAPARGRDRPAPVHGIVQKAGKPAWTMRPAQVVWRPPARSPPRPAHGWGKRQAHGAAGSARA